VPLRVGKEVQELPRVVVERGISALAKPAILVVAAALYDGDGRVLIAERPAGKHMAGRWEFPGGKVVVGESEAEALAREIREELGVEITGSQPFMRLAHSYDDRDVELSMWVVEAFQGECQGLDGQRLKWVAPARLSEEDILEADRPFVEALQERSRSAATGDASRHGPA
jgi:8-oxo-dGTP diphosphatase